MKTKKTLLVVYCFFISTHIFCQHLTLSRDIENTETTRQVVTLWEKYLKECDQTSAYAKYWKQSDSHYTSMDLIMATFNVCPIYLMGDLFTCAVTRTDSVTYIIHSISSYQTSENKPSLMAIYKVVAKDVGGEFKLYNYFDEFKSKLNMYKTDRIHYYYPSSYPFDADLAKHSVLFISTLREKYNIPDNSILTYILGNDVNECNSFLGFDYSITGSNQKHAGLFTPPNIILSPVINHYHELVHSIFSNEYPFSSRLFHEGIATYYGGSSNISYQELKEILKNMLFENPDMNLADFDSMDVLVDGKINPFYIIGAALIDHALTKGGEKKVLSLFNYDDTPRGIEKALASEFGVRKRDIHRFLFNLISAPAND